VRSGPKEVLKDEPLLLLHAPSECDYFALKVFTGSANLEASVDTLQEVIVEEGTKATLPLIPFRQATGHFVNLSDFRSTLVYSFSSGGEDISKSTDWNRTINLEFNGSSTTKTWKTAADRITVEAVHGRALVKVGHPFESNK